MEATEKRIERNYKAVMELEEGIAYARNDACKLELISLCSILYSEFTTGVYSSAKIEQSLNRIGKKIKFKQTEAIKKAEYLIVMTNAANIGGHSVIANNWITWDTKAKYSIVFTDSAIKLVPYFLKNAVKKSGGKLFFLQGEYLQRAEQLLNISQSFSKIILLQHMFDIVPNLAYSNNNWKTPIFLYNHANFKFSLGYTISDRVLNLLNYDCRKTIECRGVQENNSLVLQFPNGGNILGIAQENFPSKESVFCKYNLKDNKKLVVSMGADFKFKDIEECSFKDFAKSLALMREDIQYVIIGPNPDDQNWEKVQRETNGRVSAIGYIRREEARTIISCADLYITSFPMISSGANIADLYKVPYLLMDISGREHESFAQNSVFSIQDLLDKANSILDGDKETYLGTYYQKVIDQENWCRRWHNIADSVTVHTGQRIIPKRIIGTEELVNCQLMQERANETVKAMLQTHRLTPLIADKLFEVCVEYDLHFMPDSFSITEWNIQRKNEALASYTNKWLQLKLKGISIADYLKERGIWEVAIYGMGQMGLNLYTELKDTDISIECFIDRNANRLNSPISIIGIEEIPKQSHYIINTALLTTEQLRNSYTCLPENYEIVALFDVLDTLYGRPE